MEQHFKEDLPSAHQRSVPFKQIGMQLTHIDLISCKMSTHTHTPLPHPGYTILPELVYYVAALLRQFLDGHTRKNKQTKQAVEWLMSFESISVAALVTPEHLL